MSQQKFTCKEDKKRLDLFLKEQLGGYSRTKIQKAIKKKAVLVNDVVTTVVHEFLEVGDQVEIDIEQIQVKQKVDDGSVDFKVHYEDSDILVIEKPAGVIVHQFREQPEYSLVDEIVKRYPDIAKVGDDPVRPGIVHRLDKNASGVMVIARTQETFENLKDQFRNRNVHKEYIVLVDGLVEKVIGTIDFRIGRSDNAKNRMAAFPANTEDGKEAVTHYEVIENYKKNSLLRVKIETGRTHQIRVHMHAFGHPVVGDYVYIPKKSSNSLELDRIFLHACQIGFDHPVTGERMDFDIGLPKDLQEVLEELKN